MVDFTLGGHKCERPQDVRQGRADDMFEVTPEPQNRLLWRANAIAARSLKATNVASHFPWSKLEASSLELAPCSQQFRKNHWSNFDYLIVSLLEFISNNLKYILYICIG